MSSLPLLFLDQEVDDFFAGTTFGLEFDFNTADRRIDLPPGFTYCDTEINSHDKNGIQVDPLLEFNMFGGEVQFKPVNSELELFNSVYAIANLICHTEITNPAAVHVHVRIPALLERPDVLRHLLHWGQEWDERILRHVFHTVPLDRGKFNAKEWKYHEWFDRANYWCKVLPYLPDAIARADACTSESVHDIADALHNHVDDMKSHLWDQREGNARVMRPAVNYGHLNINETIEFRSFICTLDPVKLRNIIAFPLRYLRMALTGDKDPEKISRGVDYLEYFNCGQPDENPQVRLNRGNTSLYFNNREQMKMAIAALFISKKISLRDLNYPQFWIDQGFD